MLRGRKRKVPSSFVPEPYFHNSDSDLEEHQLLEDTTQTHGPGPDDDTDTQSTSALSEPSQPSEPVNFPDELAHGADDDTDTDTQSTSDLSEPSQPSEPVNLPDDNGADDDTDTDCQSTSDLISSDDELISSDEHNDEREEGPYDAENQSDNDQQQEVLWPGSSSEDSEDIEDEQELHADQELRRLFHRQHQQQHQQQQHQQQQNLEEPHGDDPDPDDEGNASSEEEEEDYFAILDELKEKWMSAELEHTISQAASNELWEICFKFIPKFFEARSRQNISKKPPTFNHVRRTLYDEKTPEVQLEIGYIHKESKELTVVEDTVTPKSRFPPNEYEKIYKVGSVKVNLTLFFYIVMSELCLKYFK